MRNWAFDLNPGGRDIDWAEDEGDRALTHSASPDDASPTDETVQFQPVDLLSSDTAPPAESVESPDPAPAAAPDEVPAASGGRAAALSFEDHGYCGWGFDYPPAIHTTSDGTPLSQILHDRPDVFQLFFTEYYGPNNDRNSHAWNDRVGGATPEDYARYWYESGGKYSYAPSDGGSASSPVDPSAYAGGRTTSDGVYLDQILHDRPDVFQLFFTEYYGPNNDRHSSAWMDRVGGATPQDYARYWYDAGGKYEYQPEPPRTAPQDPPAEDSGSGPLEPDPAAWTPDIEAPADAAPPVESPDPPVDDALLLVGQSLSGMGDKLFG